MSMPFPPPIAEANPPRTNPPALKLDFSAAILSYLVPGLGQIFQGRVGKGLLFMFSLYAMFFYGMYLGQWSNVFLADTAVQNPAWKLPTLATNLYNRPHFAGQFWIGVAAWPAIWHYWHDKPHQDRGPMNTTREFFAKFEAAPSESELNKLQQDSDKHWDLGWVYTVIAGVLNVLVIYDALAGPAFHANRESADKEARRAAT